MQEQMLCLSKLFQEIIQFVDAVFLFWLFFDDGTWFCDVLWWFVLEKQKQSNQTTIELFFKQKKNKSRSKQSLK